MIMVQGKLSSYFTKGHERPGQGSKGASGEGSVRKGYEITISLPFRLIPHSMLVTWPTDSDYRCLTGAGILSL